MNKLEIKIPGDAVHQEPEFPAYAILPNGARRGIVIIHEILGRQPEIDRVVERFARAGYAAIAPDLFFAGRLACLRAVFRAMQTGEEVMAVRQAKLARRWLCEKAGLSQDQVGLIGFCFGGGFALLAGPGWAAVSSNYGVIPSTEAMRGIGPVIACYGGRDVLFRKNGETLTERLAPLGVDPEVHVFPEAGHAFLTDGHHPIASALSWPLMHVHYNSQTADDAWGKIEAFFARHLTKEVNY